MITSPVSTLAPTGGNQVPGSRMRLKSEDFIKMMITQLQNQDPMEPAKNEQLLAQMSEIGQLEASTSLQDSLKSLVLQNNIGAAGNLIGKMVQGADERGEKINGVVTSVQVQDGNVALELDTGKHLAMDHVISIGTAPAHSA